MAEALQSQNGENLLSQQQRIANAINIVDQALHPGEISLGSGTGRLVETGKQSTVEQIEQVTPIQVQENGDIQSTNLVHLLKTRGPEIANILLSPDRYKQLVPSGTPTPEQRIALLNELIHLTKDPSARILAGNFDNALGVLGVQRKSVWINGKQVDTTGPAYTVAALQAAVIEQAQDAIAAVVKEKDAKTEEERKKFETLDSHRGEIYGIMRPDLDTGAVELTGQYGAAIDRSVSLKIGDDIQEVPTSQILLILRESLNDKSPDSATAKQYGEKLAAIVGQNFADVPAVQSFVETYNKYIKGQASAAEITELQRQVGSNSFRLKEEGTFLAKAFKQKKESFSEKAEIDTAVREDLMAAQQIINSMVPAEFHKDIILLENRLKEAKAAGNSEQVDQLARDINAKRQTMYRAVMAAYDVRPENLEGYATTDKNDIAYTAEENLMARQIRERRDQVITYTSFTGEKKQSTRSVMNAIDANRQATKELIESFGIDTRKLNWGELEASKQAILIDAQGAHRIALREYEKQKNNGINATPPPRLETFIRNFLRDEIRVELNLIEDNPTTEVISDVLVNRLNTELRLAGYQHKLSEGLFKQLKNLITGKSASTETQTAIESRFKNLTGDLPEHLALTQFRDMGLKGVEFLQRRAQSKPTEKPEGTSIPNLPEIKKLKETPITLMEERQDSEMEDILKKLKLADIVNPAKPEKQNGVNENGQNESDQEREDRAKQTRARLEKLREMVREKQKKRSDKTDNEPVTPADNPSTSQPEPLAANATETNNGIQPVSESPEDLATNRPPNWILVNTNSSPNDNLQITENQNGFQPPARIPTAGVPRIWVVDENGRSQNQTQLKEPTDRSEVHSGQLQLTVNREKPTEQGTSRTQAIMQRFQNDPDYRLQILEGTKKEEKYPELANMPLTLIDTAARAQPQLEMQPLPPSRQITMRPDTINTPADQTVPNVNGNNEGEAASTVIPDTIDGQDDTVVTPVTGENGDGGREEVPIIVTAPSSDSPNTENGSEPVSKSQQQNQTQYPSNGNNGTEPANEPPTGGAAESEMTDTGESDTVITSPPKDLGQTDETIHTESDKSPTERVYGPETPAYIPDTLGSRSRGGSSPQPPTLGEAAEDIGDRVPDYSEELGLEEPTPEYTGPVTYRAGKEYKDWYFPKSGKGIQYHDMYEPRIQPVKSKDPNDKGKFNIRFKYPKQRRPTTVTINLNDITVDENGKLLIPGTESKALAHIIREVEGIPGFELPKTVQEALSKNVPPASPSGTGNSGSGGTPIPNLNELYAQLREERERNEQSPSRIPQTSGTAVRIPAPASSQNTPQASIATATATAVAPLQVGSAEIVEETPSPDLSEAASDIDEGTNDTESRTKFNEYGEIISPEPATYFEPLTDVNKLRAQVAELVNKDNPTQEEKAIATKELEGYSGLKAAAFAGWLNENQDTIKSNLYTLLQYIDRHRNGIHQVAPLNEAGSEFKKTFNIDPFNQNTDENELYSVLRKIFENGKFDDRQAVLFLDLLHACSQHIAIDPKANAYEPNKNIIFLYDSYKEALQEIMDCRFIDYKSSTSARRPITRAGLRYNDQFIAEHDASSMKDRMTAVSNV